ncbi:hypothetical protein D3OALGA1CA_5420 [Olavius algarvensis associated proteobacterium Delta 3]|nr:hypothetical protein D3OALGB2SA_1565 [Olavius algarvensis associated proteobacterium Delta 3]CAB5166436.1 hypothetical protein D3OALGA1CA_5420 [Olavius algarvensis associated proteobacterium Delta 3]
MYAYDDHEPQKQKIAQQLITEGIQQENAVLPVQVLSEFFNVVTKQIQNPMSAGEVRQIITVLSILQVQEMDLSMVGRAIDTHAKYRISYRDALIISAAERTNCTVILTEDVSDTQSYRDIVVVNPFNQQL